MILSLKERQSIQPVYQTITDILTNGQLDLSKLEDYLLFKKTMDADDFDCFYESWIDTLKEHHFLAHTDAQTTMEQFVAQIEAITKQCNINFDTQLAIDRYNSYMKTLGLEHINFDVLQANIVASMLRPYQLELIVLFDGYNNQDFCVIFKDKIESLKEKEAYIK